MEGKKVLQALGTEESRQGLLIRLSRIHNDQALQRIIKTRMDIETTRRPLRDR